jgi:hypothetical protein
MTAAFLGSRSDAGSALVITLLAILLLSALGTAMVMVTTLDSRAAANQRDALAAAYAAEGALERAARELAAATDWDPILAGEVQSSQVDGAPLGARVVPDGGTIVLETVPNLASCGGPSACSTAALDAVTAERPWGRNNPRWRLFAYGPFPPAASPPSAYVVVLVADDPAETDDDPSRDGAPATAGHGVALMRAEAFGPGGSRRSVEATVRRVVGASGLAAPRILSWVGIR